MGAMGANKENYCRLNTKIAPSANMLFSLSIWTWTLITAILGCGCFFSRFFIILVVGAFFLGRDDIRFGYFPT